MILCVDIKQEFFFILYIGIMWVCLVAGGVGDGPWGMPVAGDCGAAAVGGPRGGEVLISIFRRIFGSSGLGYNSMEF